MLRRQAGWLCTKATARASPVGLPQAGCSNRWGGRSSRRHPRTCCRQGCAGHRFGELQILGLLHHHLQLLAGPQQFGAGGAVALGREGDPVEAAAERIHAAGLQVQGHGQWTSRGLCLPCRKPTVCPVSALDLIAADLPQRGAEAAEIVMERLPTGDHHEGGPSRGGGCGFAGQLRQAAVRVAALRPGVLGVAPGAAHRAARQADEEGAAAGMEPFALQGVEGLDDGQGQRSQGGHALGACKG